MEKQIRSYFLFVLMLACISVSHALPKFASRTGAKCQSCHVNPTGKGMRSEFGRNYGMEDLAMPTWREATDFEEFSVGITPNIDVGMDMRTLLFFNEQKGTSSFFQMQGDLYFDIRLNKKVRLYLDKGLYNGFEAFALAKVLPYDGYVKVGKFMPAYGTRTDDHNAFIRGGPYGGGPFVAQFAPLSVAGYPTGLRFGERSEDTGLELGFAPGAFTLNVGMFNGTPGAGLTGVTATRNKAVVVRGDATVKFSSTNVTVGGSVYYAPSATDKHTYTGAFGAISFLESYTLTSEVDLVKVEDNASGKATNGMIVWNEINAVVTQGIDIKIGYEFYDPDLDITNGSFTRALVGAEIFLLSGVEFRPLYRINLEEPTDVSNNEFQAMLHLYF